VLVFHKKNGLYLPTSSVGPVVFLAFAVPASQGTMGNPHPPIRTTKSNNHPGTDQFIQSFRINKVEFAVVVLNRYSHELLLPFPLSMKISLHVYVIHGYCAR
jgi:hypothetical protein